MFEVFVVTSIILMFLLIGVLMQGVATVEIKLDVITGMSENTSKKSSLLLKQLKKTGKK